MTVPEIDPRPASPVVELDHGGPQPQRRVTIAFRAILLIPHWVWLYLVAIATGFALIGAWFGALFTGRVPVGLHRFIGRFLQYLTRVMAYGGLLTDEYPSFDLSPDEAYPFELVLPPRDRLNRAAVLFRYFLAIPAAILAGIVGAGLGFSLFFIWLIVLVKGRVPRSLHEAMTAVLRYAMRAYAYYALLTSEYPHRLYGDKVAPTTEPVDLAAAPPPVGEPLADLPAEGRSTRLVLSKAGRRIVTLFIVLAVVGYAGLFAVGAIAGSQGDKAADRLEAQHARLDADIRDYTTAIQSCGLDGGVQCVHDADHDLAAALVDFRAELRDVTYPRAALGLASQLEDDTDQLIDLLHQREDTEDVATYQSLSARFQDVASRFDEDYRTLILQLRF
jgi:hypothetical protein